MLSSDQTDPFIANLMRGATLPLPVVLEVQVIRAWRLLANLEDLLFEGSDDYRPWEEMDDATLGATFDPRKSYERSQRMIALWTVLDRNR